jgi:hypothetical protein
MSEFFRNGDRVQLHASVEYDGLSKGAIGIVVNNNAYDELWRDSGYDLEAMEQTPQYPPWQILLVKWKNAPPEWVNGEGYISSEEVHHVKR